MSWFTKRTAYGLLALLMVLSFGLWMMSPQWSRTNEGSVIISGNVPPALLNSQLIGHSNPQQQIDVVIGLKLRNEQQLNRLIQAQSDPKSPVYRIYLTPKQFLQYFAPTQPNVDKVVAQMKRDGLTVVQVTPDRMLIQVRGTIDQIEKAFNVTINVYNDNGRQVISNDRNPSVPANLHDIVQSVMGLNTFAQFHSKMEMGKRHANDTPSGYGPQDIATAYNYPNINNTWGNGKLSGKGVTVAIATAYTYDWYDVQAYWHYYGIHRTGKVDTLHINGGTKKLNGETTLDLEQVGAQAPGANIIMYEGKDPSFASFALVFDRIVSDDQASVATVSWGSSELDTGQAEMATEHTLFKIGAAEGISFFAAAGDSGAYDSQSQQGVMSADYPASDPYVTAVGGTSLTVGFTGTRKGETAWTGAGGAVSTQYGEPTWQKGPGVPQNGNRNSSDIALNADPNTGYTIYYKGSWIEAGGTSFASPNVAALFALADQANGGRIGYVAPALYRIGNSPDYGKVFYDVTKGDNGNGMGPGFSAGPGWDHPTGWGAPDGTQLVHWLVNDTATTGTPTGTPAGTPAGTPPGTPTNTGAPSQPAH